MPLEVTITGWSPFSPGDADNASLPVAGLEYSFTNRSQASIDAMFSLNAENIMAEPSKDQPDRESKPFDRIRPTPGGFILYGPGAKDRPWDEGCCAAWVNDERNGKPCLVPGFPEPPLERYPFRRVSREGTAARRPGGGSVAVRATHDSIRCRKDHYIVFGLVRCEFQSLRARKWI